jgi:fumarylacetoacetase
MGAYWIPRAQLILGQSGQKFHRPIAQLGMGDEGTPIFGPSKKLDHELELAIYVARPNPQGQPVSIAEAESHLFGLGLLNDWSARDVQAWEYQPLGPFLAKNFASTLSPWIVTLEALEPFRTPFLRSQNDPQPLPYLDDEANRARGAIDIKLEVWIQTQKMRDAGLHHEKLMQSNFKDSYWTIAQLLTHHTATGCNMQPGDMMGTGTQSGATAEQGGSMLELSLNGKNARMLKNGEARTFLQDGDSIMLRARCEQNGYRSIGFGDCEGSILAALGSAVISCK